MSDSCFCLTFLRYASAIYKFKFDIGNSLKGHFFGRTPFPKNTSGRLFLPNQINLIRQYYRSINILLLHFCDQNFITLHKK